MKQVKNLNNKRVFDISDDKKSIIVRLKEDVTIITANADGTLKFIHKHEIKSA